jgi:hypothetical protein
VKSDTPCRKILFLFSFFGCGMGKKVAEFTKRDVYFADPIPETWNLTPI